MEESLVNTISDQAQLSELARDTQDARMAHFDIKHKKLELQLELEQIYICKQDHKLKLEQACKQHATDEHILLFK